MSAITPLDIALWAVHHATTLLFGVFASATLCDVELNRRNVIELLTVCTLTGAGFAAASFCIGESFARQVYPLIVHLPLGLFLALRHRRRPLIIVLAITTAYLTCQISNWVGLAALALSGTAAVYYAARIVTTLAVFAAMLKYVPSIAPQLAAKTSTELSILVMLPAVYYIFDYATNVYTGLFHSGSVVTVEFLAFALCLFYVLFLTVYLREYEAKERARRESWLVESRSVQATRELDAWRRSARELSVLRHDMRHYLRGLSALLEEGKIDEARERIDAICDANDRTAVHRYSSNETVNIALSSFDGPIAQRGIVADYRVAVPEQIGLSDIDLFSVISNAVENAITASGEAVPEHRFVDVDLRLEDEKLLLEVSNTFDRAPVMVDGMPQAGRSGHGFGTQSIRLAVERMGGNCQFSVEGDRFILRAII